MKKIILSICTLVLISLFHISCNKEDIKPNRKEGAVEFGFSLKAPLHSGAQKSSMKAPAVEPAAVVVSIKKANGNSAYTMQKVDLYNMNGYYISKSLSFLPGSYTVEQFFVVDAAGNVMYATPLQGSPKAYLVSEPLPISFTVSKDAVTKIVPEVLSTEDSTPEDFGYSTFSFEVVKTFDFLIGVFVYNESTQNFELTNANLTIVAASKTIFTDTLAAITNKVTVNDGYDSYFLTVTKDGYKTWTDTLTAAELKLYFRSEDKGPLEVILEKQDVDEISIKINQDGSEEVYSGNVFRFEKTARLTFINDENASIFIDWGDNSGLEKINSSTIEHIYSNYGIYNIRINGEVNKIIVFAINDDIIGNVKVIDMKFAKATSLVGLSITSANRNEISAEDLSTNIKSLTIYGNNLNSIDISKLEKLEYIEFQCPNMSYLNTSNNPNINYINFGFGNQNLNLNFSNNSKLETIYLTGTADNLVDLSKCLNLKELTISNNIANVDLKDNKNLKSLYIYNNKALTNLDLSENRNIETLFIEVANSLSCLNLSKNINLSNIHFQATGFDQNEINLFYVNLLVSVQQNPRSGKFSCVDKLDIMPTAEGLAALNSLKNQYNWTFFSCTGGIYF